MYIGVSGVQMNTLRMKKTEKERENVTLLQSQVSSTRAEQSNWRRKIGGRERERDVKYAYGFEYA